LSGLRKFYKTADGARDIQRASEARARVADTDALNRSRPASLFRYLEATLAAGDGGKFDEVVIGVQPLIMSVHGDQFVKLARALPAEAKAKKQVEQVVYGSVLEPEKAKSDEQDEGDKTADQRPLGACLRNPRSVEFRAED
jgi:hypothetical protein